MFTHNLQSTPFVSIFDPSTSTPPTKSLFRLQNVIGNCKLYDKETKSDVFLLMKKSSAIVLPGLQGAELGLLQEFLNFQICFFGGMDWLIELEVSDSNQIKRRIHFSNKFQTVEKKLFSIKYPCPEIQHGHWMNLTIDLASFMNAFDKVYKTLNKITISGFFKLRRIFTTQNCVNFSKESDPTNFIPKKYYFPSTIKSSNFCLKYREMNSEVYEKFEASEVSTKNQSNETESESKVLPKIKLRQNNCKKPKLNKNVKLPLIGSSENKSKELEKENKTQKKSESKFLSNSQRLDPKALKFGLHKENEPVIKKDEKGREIQTERKPAAIKVRYQKPSNSPISARESNCSRFSSCFQTQANTIDLKYPVLDNDEIEEDIEFEDSFTCNEPANNKLAFPELCPKEPSDQLTTIDDLHLEVSKMDAMSQRYMRLKSFEGFGEDVIDRYMNEVERPYSPPLCDIDRATDSIIEGENSLAPKMPKHHQLELTYDPVLECYYDCKAGTYYQLKK